MCGGVLLWKTLGPAKKACNPGPIKIIRVVLAESPVDSVAPNYPAEQIVRPYSVARRLPAMLGFSPRRSIQDRLIKRSLIHAIPKQASIIEDVLAG